MSSALTNLCHSFVNTLVCIWTIFLSWCSPLRYSNTDVVVDLERGVQRPQSQGQPLPAPSPPLSTRSPGKSSFCPEYAASPFRHTTFPPPMVKSNVYLSQIIIPPCDDPGPDLGVTNMKPVDGLIVPISLPVEDDMSASGTNKKHPVSASCDASGISTIHTDNTTSKSNNSQSRSSISTSTSTPSLRVPNTSFNIFMDDQNVRSSGRAFIGRSLSPPTSPPCHRHGKGHKRTPLATITNISHVMGPSSPVIETFNIPEPSSAFPLMVPVAPGPCTPAPTPRPLIDYVADQITALPPPKQTATPSPRSLSSAISILTVRGPASTPRTPTSERSLRRVPALPNLHSPSPSRKLQKLSPSPSPKKRPVSSVVWFKDASVTPTTPLRIAKRCAGLPPPLPAAKTVRKVGVTEEELEEEVSAVKEAFAVIREKVEDDDGVAARERFNRASVWTTQTNRFSVFQLDEHMRDILDEEEDDSDEDGYGEELPSPSMRSPPPPYLLSLAMDVTDKKTVYKIPTANSLPLVSESTELAYLCSHTPFSSLDESLDDLLLSFEELIASMPSRLKTHKEMRHGLSKEANKADASERVVRIGREEKGEMACLDSPCHGTVEKTNSAIRTQREVDIGVMISS